MSDLPAPESASRDLSHAEIALLAHELRGALAIIAGYAGLLRHHPLDEREREAALDGIERAISRADALCSEALAGRPPSPYKSRVREAVSIGDLVESVAADQRLATGRDVRVAVEVDRDLMVPADGQALSRALDNLVGNAAKYSPANQPVDVRVTRATRPFLGDTAVIEIADRGSGIPAEMRELVFEPFERLDRDQGSAGTGLGLAIVRDVVIAHDGSVRILDRDGGGTVVRVELPTE